MLRPSVAGVGQLVNDKMTIWDKFEDFYSTDTLFYSYVRRGVKIGRKIATEVLRRSWKGLLSLSVIVWLNNH